MKLAGSTSFRVDSQGKSERFSLERGELVAHVAKLADGNRFVVDTPDARIEVRGTSFRLRVLDAAETCGGGSRTRLSVTEGLVEVRGAAGPGDSVAAGEHWPRDCASHELRPISKADAASSAAADASAHTPPTPRSATLAGSRAAASPSRPPSDVPEGQRSFLAAQNDLFAQGVALRRQGDVGGALRTFNELIRRFPSSPLAENAMVERLRMLMARGDASRADEAERYLARYPRGFAVQEARRALVER
jgi:FecR protein